jgi:hypothetical protein
LLFSFSIGKLAYPASLSAGACFLISSKHKKRYIYLYILRQFLRNKQKMSNLQMDSLVVDTVAWKQPSTEGKLCVWVSSARWKDFLLLWIFFDRNFNLFFLKIQIGNWRIKGDLNSAKPCSFLTSLKSSVKLTKV